MKRRRIGFGQVLPQQGRQVMRRFDVIIVQLGHYLVIRGGALERIVQGHGLHWMEEKGCDDDNSHPKQSVCRW